MKTILEKYRLGKPHNLLILIRFVKPKLRQAVKAAKKAPQRILKSYRIRQNHKKNPIFSVVKEKYGVYTTSQILRLLEPDNIT
jgi:hypothetical protein